MIFNEARAFLRQINEIKGEFLSLDLGSKKTGVAVSIYNGKMAVPWLVLYESSQHRLLLEVKLLMLQKFCKYIVLGFPFGWEESFSAKRIIEFASLLSKNGFLVLLYDENETSVKVKQTARLERGKVTKKEKQRYDANVAALILGNALDEINSIVQ